MKTGVKSSVCSKHIDTVDATKHNQRSVKGNWGTKLNGQLQRKMVGKSETGGHRHSARGVQGLEVRRA